MNFTEKIDRLQRLMSGTLQMESIVTTEMKKEADLSQIWAFFGEQNDRGLYGSNTGHLSFSFLKHVDNIRNPKFQHPNNNKERNFALGRAFEDMLTDCIDVGKFPDLTTDDFQNLEKMCEYAQSDEWISRYLQEFETQKEVEGVIKDFKFKGRIDFWNKKTLAEGIASDLKSTSAKTLNAFLRACIDFGYYTQGYIYSELIGVSTYIISGVCKSYPAVYTVQMSKTDFATGEKELDRLLENLEYYNIAHHFKVSRGYDTCKICDLEHNEANQKEFDSPFDMICNSCYSEYQAMKMAKGYDPEEQITVGSIEIDLPF